mgnify:CR=1 FL=1
MNLINLVASDCYTSFKMDISHQSKSASHSFMDKERGCEAHQNDMLYIQDTRDVKIDSTKSDHNLPLKQPQVKDDLHEQGMRNSTFTIIDMRIHIGT